MKLVKTFEEEYKIVKHHNIKGVLRIELEFKNKHIPNFFVNIFDARSVKRYDTIFVQKRNSKLKNIEFEEIDDLYDYGDLGYICKGYLDDFFEFIYADVLNYLKNNNLPPTYMDEQEGYYLDFTDLIYINCQNNIFNGEMHTNSPFLNTKYMIHENIIIFTNKLFQKTYYIDINNIEIINEIVRDYSKIFNDNIDGKFIWE